MSEENDEPQPGTSTHLDTGKRPATETLECSEPSSKPKQMKLSSYAIRPASANQTKKLNDKVLNMIILDLQPFSVVEDSGFKALEGALDPSHHLPS